MVSANYARQIKIIAQLVTKDFVKLALLVFIQMKMKIIFVQAAINLTKIAKSVLKKVVNTVIQVIILKIKNANLVRKNPIA